jgi:hypothetical protein
MRGSQEVDHLRQLTQPGSAAAADQEHDVGPSRNLLEGPFVGIGRYEQQVRTRFGEADCPLGHAECR